MSVPDPTLYGRNDDDMEDYGDISAYDDSMEEEYEEEEEEEMGEPAPVTSRGGAMSIVPRSGMASSSRPTGTPARKGDPAKKASKKKGGKKARKPAKKKGKKKAARKKKGGRRR